MTTKRNKTCMFINCGSASVLTPDKLFFCCPYNLDRRKHWFEAAGRKNLRTSHSIYCCEDHFNLEKDSKNWLAHQLMGQKIILKENVIPKKVARSTKKRTCESEVGISRELCTEESCLASREPSTLSPSRMILIGRSSKKIRPSSNFDIKVTTETARSQQSDVANDLISYKCDSTYQPQNEENEDKRDMFKMELNKIETNSRFYLGLPRTEYFIIKLLEEETKLPVINILMILKKIRTDDEFKRLGLDFGLNTSSVKKIFNKGLPILARKMQELIFWPDKYQILRLMPNQFKHCFKDVQAIFDCFEIYIEKPKETLTWSNYKNGNTSKFLVSATPNGLINFVSCGFGGKTSDLEIIEQSGYLEVVPPNAVVMTDGGFKEVEALLATHNITLFRPPSVTKNHPITPTEARQNKLIAALRVHIERVIKKLRQFKMLQPSAIIDHDMGSLLDYILIVACGIINLQKPLIKQ